MIFRSEEKKIQVGILKHQWNNAMLPVYPCFSSLKYLLQPDFINSYMQYCIVYLDLCLF